MERNFELAKALDEYHVMLANDYSVDVLLKWDPPAGKKWYDLRITLTRKAASLNGWHTCFQTQLPWVQFPAFPKQFQRKKIVDIAEVNQRSCLEESGQ